jgi:hypothetical protein
MKRTVGTGGTWAWARMNVLLDICPLVAMTGAVFLALSPRTHRQTHAPNTAFVATSVQAGARRARTVDANGNRVISFGGQA